MFAILVITAIHFIDKRIEVALEFHYIFYLKIMLDQLFYHIPILQSILLNTQMNVSINFNQLSQRI